MMDNAALRALAERLGCTLVADEGRKAEPAPEYLERFCCSACWDNFLNPSRGGSTQFEVSLKAHIESLHALGTEVVRFALYPDGSKALLERIPYAEARERVFGDKPPTRKKKK